MQFVHVVNESTAAFQATLFQTLPLQQAEAQAASGPSPPNSQAVTDVIQQLLELSDPGPAEPSQAPQPGQQLSITVGISQDILQVRRSPRSVGACQTPGRGREAGGACRVHPSRMRVQLLLDSAEF